MRTLRVVLCSAACFGLSSVQVLGQTPATPEGREAQAVARFSTAAWCQDALTVCTSGRTAHVSFSGLRLVFEPNLGIIFQNGENRFENTSFKALERVGLETNLRHSYIAIQALLIYPSTVDFDDKSPITGYIKNDSGRVGVDYGLSLGLSFLDGILATGIGYLNYDQRDLSDVNEAGVRQPKGTTTDVYFYFNVQPVSAVRSALRNQ
jgi:hypothetical protein